MRGEFSVQADNGGKLVHILGRVRANFSQTCGVTLQPLKSEIDSSVAWSFADEDCLDGEPFEFDVETADLPEPMTDGTVNLGEVMVHQLALEIEAFPRTLGLPFIHYSTESPESALTRTGNGRPRSDNPFHALKHLKEKPD